VKGDERGAIGAGVTVINLSDIANDSGSVRAVLPQSFSVIVIFSFTSNPCLFGELPWTGFPMRLIPTGYTPQQALTIGRKFLP
jgi:hypothetical protein